MSIHLLAIHSLQIVHLMKQKNKLGCYRRKDCMEWFCKNIRDHTMKIINYEEKEMIPLTDKENRSYEMQKICYIYKKEFSTDNDKKYHKSEIIVITLETIEEVLIIFVI